ncbi:hypothetical protein RclHR1_03470008 [Rhizophagus clarus]|uniref:Uncharacterized protein n=1 Tax=Rhizophagus clarus TaxID=94130 RepID=A0A2Z6RAY8_9GLOM|nr:hypothetical protein RclHR1_03470008 [Rhizophagus clarus]
MCYRTATGKKGHNFCSINTKRQGIPNRQIAKSWNNGRSQSRVYLHQPTITSENINGFVNINRNGTFVLDHLYPKEINERKIMANQNGEK